MQPKLLENLLVSQAQQPRAFRKAKATLGDLNNVVTDLATQSFHEVVDHLLARYTGKDAFTAWQWFALQESVTSS